MADTEREQTEVLKEALERILQKEKEHEQRSARAIQEVLGIVAEGIEDKSARVLAPTGRKERISEYFVVYHVGDKRLWEEQWKILRYADSSENVSIGMDTVPLDQPIFIASKRELTTEQDYRSWIDYSPVLFSRLQEMAAVQSSQPE